YDHVGHRHSPELARIQFAIWNLFSNYLLREPRAGVKQRRRGASGGVDASTMGERAYSTSAMTVRALSERPATKFDIRSHASRSRAPVAMTCSPVIAAWN